MVDMSNRTVVTRNRATRSDNTFLNAHTASGAEVDDGSLTDDTSPTPVRVPRIHSRSHAQMLVAVQDVDISFLASVLSTLAVQLCQSFSLQVI